MKKLQVGASTVAIIGFLLSLLFVFGQMGHKTNCKKDPTHTSVVYGRCSK